MGEQDWCLEGLNYSIWGNTFKSSGSSREGNMMSAGIEALGSREAQSSRAGCSSRRGFLCCSWGQSTGPALSGLHRFLPAWLMLHQPSSSVGQRLNDAAHAWWMWEQRGCLLLVQSQTEHGPGCWDQKTALIYLPFCLFTASKLPASHCELSFLCSLSSCGISSISLS